MLFAEKRCVNVDWTSSIICYMNEYLEDIFFLKAFSANATFIQFPIHMHFNMFAKLTFWKRLFA